MRRRIYREIYEKLDVLFGGIDHFFESWGAENRREAAFLRSDSKEEKIMLLRAGLDGVEFNLYRTEADGRAVVYAYVEIRIFKGIKLAEALAWLPPGTLLYKTAYKNPGKIDRLAQKEMNAYLSTLLDRLKAEGFHWVNTEAQTTAPK